MKSGSGGGRGKGTSSKSSAPGCLSGVPEMRIADLERSTTHADSKCRGRRCESSRWRDCSDRRHYGSHFAADKNAARCARCGGRGRPAAGATSCPRRCGRNAKQEQVDEAMEGTHMKRTSPEGSIKRKSIHAACDEEVMKAMRAAKALDPSIHLGDTQAWQTRENKEADVVMKADTRSREG